MLCSGRCQELYTQLCSKPAEVFPRIMIAYAGSQLVLFEVGIGFFTSHGYLRRWATYLVGFRLMSPTSTKMPVP